MPGRCEIDQINSVKDGPENESQMLMPALKVHDLTGKESV